MSTINISDLRSTGTDLFSDSESYMSELSDKEIFNVNGGLISIFCNTTFTTVMIPILSREVVKRYL